MPTFDVLGRLVVEIRRSEGRWVAIRVGQGVKTPIHDFVIPSGLAEGELGIFLDDVCHELAKPGQTVRCIGP